MPNLKSVNGKTPLGSRHHVMEWKQAAKLTQRVNEIRVVWKDTQDRQTLRQANRKRVMIQMNKIRTEKGTITTDTNEIEKFIRSYLKNKYSTKLENQKHR